MAAKARAGWAMVDVMGGMMAYGISGLFVGPIVLAVLWVLIQEWMVEG